MYEYGLSTDNDSSFLLSYISLCSLPTLPSFLPSLPQLWRPPIIETLFLSSLQLFFSTLLLSSFKLTYLPSLSRLPSIQFLSFFLPSIPSLLFLTSTYSPSRYGHPLFHLQTSAIDPTPWTRIHCPVLGATECFSRLQWWFRLRWMI